jgi:AhpD family alkylhydroperoxidase
MVYIRDKEATVMESKTTTSDGFEQLRRASPKVTGALVRMREATYSDGAVPAKYKVLAALAISVIIKCEPCIKAYVEMARDRYGVRWEELIEFLNVAITMGGCPGEEWALKALSYWSSSPEPDRAASLEGDGALCCQTDVPTGG